MKTLLPLILCLLLTACSKPTVSFFGVPIEGTLDSFLNAISETEILDIRPETVDFDSFTSATGECQLGYRYGTFTEEAKEIVNEYGDPDSEVTSFFFSSIADGQAGIDDLVERLDDYYGKHKANSYYYKDTIWWEVEGGRIWLQVYWTVDVKFERE